jgi:hypothetical protein
VDEGLQALKSEELVPAEHAQEQAIDTQGDGSSAPPPSVAGVPVNWLRLALTLEFLLALMTVYTLWSEIGGQGHLDLLPWYTKLVCGVGLSWSVVRFTSGLVQSESAWNRRTLRWSAVMVLFMVAMGGIVYYYHLHETPDEPDSEDAAATSVQLPRGGKLSQRI